jgi:hypothetical protein
MLTRRRLLASMAGLSTLAAAGAFKTLVPGKAAPGFLVLDTDGVRITRAIAEAVIGKAWVKAPVVEELDKTLAALPEVGELWKYLPLFLEQSTRLDGHFEAFSELTIELRQEVLMSWGTSTLLEQRQIYHALRDLLLSHFYFQPESWEDIFYSGPWIGRFALSPFPLRFPMAVQ